MNKIITWLEAHSKLGGGPSPTPTKCATKQQLLNTFDNINSNKLSTYSNTQIVKTEDVEKIVSNLIYENPGSYNTILEPGEYMVLVCGAGGSGANDGSRSGNASSGGNSGAAISAIFSISASISVTTVVGKGGVMTDTSVDTNGVNGTPSALTLGKRTIGATGGLGGCSFDGYSAAHVGNNIIVDNQIQQGTNLISNPDTDFFTNWIYEPNRIGGHNVKFSTLCKNSVGFTGPLMSFDSFGVESIRYGNNITNICSSGTGGLNTYGGGLPFQNPGVNGGGASNQGDSLAPVSASHGKWPGCGGGGRNFTAAHSGIGGNGVDGIVIITRIG